ncbi:MAG TPA: transglycosylase domain-containing protein [Candidatus Saccharimonadales bacterium]|nr:transglycosylase domain-containing protein [Candidatus Saccharimonadales bacterium]
MNTPNKNTGRKRPGKSTFTTKSGNTIKLNQSFSDRFRANRAAKARKRATQKSAMPQNWFKRMLYRLQPKRMYHYWFSREGAIMALKISGVGIIVVFILLVGLFAYFRKDLPQIKDISGDNLGGSIIYYDRTGQTVLWQDYNAVKRVPVKSDQISPYMKEATVAIEDKDFYHEGAFNVRGIVRAGVHDVFGSGGGTQGGSTITQQLVKLNQEWTADRSITRKIKELALAVDLEREYSKDDILTGYLNIAPYGNVQYGVQSAAQDYFGVDAKDLTLAQATMLAAIPQSPGYYSPYNSPQYNAAATEDNFGSTALVNRQHYILDQMVKQGYIKQSQADEAKKVDILAQVHPFQQYYAGIKAPYFVLTAKQQLENKYGAATVQRGGWKVTTTLDLNLQNSAETLVADNYSNIKTRTGGAADEEALVTENVPTGQIVALVGGTNFNDPDHGQNNYASGILIPPGSSFKPYDYTTLIDNNNNVGAGSVIYDTQGPLPAQGYECTNKALPKNGGNCLEDYDFLYPGPVTLRYALGGSRNVPAVKAMLMAVPNDSSTQHVNSINKVIGTATAMMDNPYVKGNTYNCFSDEQNTATTQCYASSAIGDGAFLHLDDHVNGLSTIARLGQAIPKTYILKITDSAGKTVDQWTQPKAKQAVKADAAYIVDDMASDPNASYLPGSCTATTCTPLAHDGYKFQRDNGWHFAVKTGTTNNGFDGLMTSWSTQYAVVSWVGNHMRNLDLTTRGASMEQLTEPLTRGMMEAAHANMKPVNWTAPADIKTLPAFVITNHIHYGDIEPSPSTDLFPSWYTGKTGSNTSQVIDKVSGKVATSCTPDLAKQSQGNGNGNAFSIDIFVTGHSATSTTATDDVHHCDDAKPSVTLTAPPSCVVGSACTFTVTVTQGTHSLSSDQFPGTVNLYVDGNKVGSQNASDSPSTVTFSYTPTSAEAATIKAEAIDSVLYSGTNEATTSFTAAPATQTTSPVTPLTNNDRPTQRRSGRL